MIYIFDHFIKASNFIQFLFSRVFIRLIISFNTISKTGEMIKEWSYKIKILI